MTDPFKFRECMSILKKLIKEFNDKSLRLSEKLKQQPTHIQEAFYVGGGRYHEAPLAKPSRRQEVSFRDDANTLTKYVHMITGSIKQRIVSSTCSTSWHPLRPCHKSINMMCLYFTTKCLK